MFEKTAAELVERICGRFIQDVDPEQMKISMWKGEVELQDVKLRATALDSLNLPVAVKDGQLAHIHLKIPWKRLGSAPVKVTVVIRKEQVGIHDQQHLAAEVLSQLARSRELALSQASRDKSSFTGRLLANVVDNLIIHISNVSIRYVDHCTLSSSPFAVVVSVDTFAADTASADWEAVDFAVNEREIRKLFTLTGLSVQWQRISGPGQTSHEAANAGSRADYVLEPVSATGRVCLVKSDAVAQNEPVMSVAVSVGEVRLCVDQVVARDLAALADTGLGPPAASLRSRCRAAAPEKGRWRAWWKWAASEVLAAQGAEQSLWASAGVVEATLRGIEYAKLFKRGLSLLPLPELTEAEVARMAVVSGALPAAFLEQVRRVALQSIREQVESMLSSAPRAPQCSRGVWSRLLYAARSGEGLEHGPPSAMSDDERRGLEAVLESARSGAAQQTQMLEGAPDDYVAFRFELSAAAASVAVASVRCECGAPCHSHEAQGHAPAAEHEQVRTDVGVLEMKETRALLLKPRFNHSLHVAVGSLKAEGAGGGGEGLVEVLGVDASQDERDLQLGEEGGAGWFEEEAGSRALFVARLERAPRCGGYERAVRMRLRRVRLTHREECVRRVLAWSQDLLQDMQRHGIAARRVPAVSARSLALMQDRASTAVAERQLVKVDGLISMPKILVPAGTAPTSDHSLVVELGNIRLSTSSRAGQPDQGAGVVYRLELAGCQLDLQPAEGERARVLHPLSCEFTLTLPDQTEQDGEALAPVEAALHLDTLQGALTPTQMRSLLGVVASWRARAQSVGTPQRASHQDEQSPTHSTPRVHSGAVGTRPAQRPSISGLGAARRGSVKQRIRWRRVVKVGCMRLTLVNERGVEVGDMSANEIAAVDLVADGGQDMEVTIRRIDLSYALSNFADLDPHSSGSHLMCDPSAFNQPRYRHFFATQNPEEEEEIDQTWLVMRWSHRQQPCGQPAPGIGVGTVTCSAQRVWSALCPRALNALLAWLKEADCLASASHTAPTCQCGPQDSAQSDHHEWQCTVALAGVEVRLVDIERGKPMDIARIDIVQLNVLEEDKQDGAVVRSVEIHRFEIEDTHCADELSYVVLADEDVGDESVACWRESAHTQVGRARSREITVTLNDLRVNLVSRFVENVAHCVSVLNLDALLSRPSNANAQRFFDSCVVVPRCRNVMAFVPGGYEPETGMLFKLDAAPDDVESPPEDAVIESGAMRAQVEMEGLLYAGDGVVHSVFGLRGRVSLLSCRSDGAAEHRTDVRIHTVRLSGPSHVVALVKTMLTEARDSWAAALSGPPATESRTLRSRPTQLPAKECQTSNQGDQNEEDNRALMFLEVCVEKAFVAMGTQQARSADGAVPFRGTDGKGLSRFSSDPEPGEACYSDVMVMHISDVKATRSLCRSGSRMHKLQVGSVMLECNDRADYGPDLDWTDASSFTDCRRVFAFEKEDGHTRKVQRMTAKYVEAFKQSDSLERGFLETEELIRALAALGVSVNEEQAATLHEKLDINHDGQLELREFVELVRLVLSLDETDTRVDSALAEHGAGCGGGRTQPRLQLRWECTSSGHETVAVHVPRFEVDLGVTASAVAGLYHALALDMSETQSNSSARSSRGASSCHGSWRPSHNHSDLWGLLGVMARLREPMRPRGHDMGASLNRARVVWSWTVEGAEVSLAGGTPVEGKEAAFQLQLESLRASGLFGLESPEFKLDVHAAGTELVYVENERGCRLSRQQVLKKTDISVQQHTAPKSSNPSEREFVMSLSVSEGIEVQLGIHHAARLVALLQNLRGAIRHKGLGPHAGQLTPELNSSFHQGFGSSFNRGSSRTYQRWRSSSPLRGSRSTARSSSSPTRQRFSQHMMGSFGRQGRPSSQSGRLRRVESAEEELNRIEDERLCEGEDVGIVCGQWSVALGAITVSVHDGMSSHVPFARVEVQEVSLGGLVSSTTHCVRGNATLACAAYHDGAAQWEPLVEAWPIQLQSTTTRGDPKQYLTISAATALEVSLGADHLRRATAAHAGFLQAIQKEHDALLEAAMAPQFERVNSDVVRKKELSSFVNDISTQSNRVFTNLTSVALELKLHVKLDNACWVAVVEAGETALIPELLLRSRTLFVRSRRPAGTAAATTPISNVADDWSGWSRGLEQVADMTDAAASVECCAADDSWRVVIHLRVCNNGKGLSAHPPWKLHSLLPHAATFFVSDRDDSPADNTARFPLSAGAEVEMLGSDLTCGPTTFLQISVCGLNCVGWVPVGGEGTSVAEEIELRDQLERSLRLFIHTSRNEQHETVLSVFAHTVMVNRTGLPLLFGWKPTKDPTRSSTKPRVHVAAGQGGDEAVHASAAGWRRDGEGWIRSAAAARGLGGASWNELEPETVLASPDPHAGGAGAQEWSPCVAVTVDARGSDAKWTSVALQNNGQVQGLRVEGMLAVGVDEQSDGHLREVQTQVLTTFHIAVTIRMGEGPFHRTTYMDFAPLYTIINRTGQTIQATQFPFVRSHSAVLQIEDDHLMSTCGAFRDREEYAEHRLQFRMMDEDGNPLTSWSGPFGLARERTFPLRLLSANENDGEREAQHVVCEVSRLLASTVITLIPHDEAAPLMQVINATDCCAHLWQLGSERAAGAVEVDRGESRILSWDNPDALLTLAASFGPAAGFVKVNVDQFEDSQEVDLGHYQIVVHSRMVGCCKMVHIRNAHKHQALNKTTENTTFLECTVTIGSIGMSLVDPQRRELLYASLREVQFVSIVRAGAIICSVTVEQLDVDNQTNHGPCKAFLSPYGVPQRGSFASDAQSRFLRVSGVLSREASSIPYWREISVDTGDFSLQLEEEWLHMLLAFEQRAAAAQGTAASERGSCERVVRPETGAHLETEELIRALSLMDTDGSRALLGAYIHALTLSQCCGVVSVFGMAAATCRPVGAARGAVGALYRGASAAAAVLPLADLSRHSWELPAWSKDAVRLQRGSGVLGVGSLLWAHYRARLVGEALRIMGSAGYWASYLGTAGESVEEVLGRQQRAALGRGDGAEGGEEGQAQGLGALTDGIARGLVGLWEKPAQALKKGGAAEVVAGLGQGVLGLFAKPASSLLHIGHSVANHSFSGGPHPGATARVRLSRAVYTDGLLRAYDAADAATYAAMLDRIREEGEDPSSPCGPSRTPELAAADDAGLAAGRAQAQPDPGLLEQVVESHRIPAISPRDGQ